MATAVGHPDVAQKWTDAANAMTQAFKRYHVVPASGGRPAYVSAVTGLARDGSWRPSPVVMQAAQTVAIFTGLINASLAGPLLDYTFPSPDGSPRDGVLRWNNPSYLRRVLKALSSTNRTARAIAHLKERFSQYLPGNKANPTAPALQGPLGGPLPEYWVSRIDLGLKPGQNDNAQVCVCARVCVCVCVCVYVCVCVRVWRSERSGVYVRTYTHTHTHTQTHTHTHTHTH
jgi:hypothetical protein